LRDEAVGVDGEPLPCYEFNANLKPLVDDGVCEHCRKWLTVDCEIIDDFIGEEEYDDDI